PLHHRVSLSVPDWFASSIPEIIMPASVAATDSRAVSRSSAELFDAPFDDDWIPRYNLAPTQPVPAMRRQRKEPRRVLSLKARVLCPEWALAEVTGGSRRCARV